MSLNIRSHSWFEASISWAHVVEEILYAAELLGNKAYLISTNGYQGMNRWNSEKSIHNNQELREFLRGQKPFDIDLTYTVPQNFPDRFLSSSKKKMSIFAYESSIMPKTWKPYYSVVDYILPPSEYCAQMIKKNGCPEEKIVVVPHGIDLEIFNPEVEPAKLATEKKFKFFCLAEPHYRKQIPELLDIYCKTFTSKDDVSLFLKTKIFTTAEEEQEKKGFEIDLKPVLSALKKKYGEQIPEIKIIGHRVPNIAKIYRACNAFVLMTASEGWGIPFLEALACGLTVIAPRHGGQLQFLNDENSILTKCGVRRARSQEIYWGGDPKGVVGNPDPMAYQEAMRGVVTADTSSKVSAGIKTAQGLTWKAATQQILNLAQ